jgi:hypothetical protein
MQLPPHFVEWANLIALQDFHVCPWHILHFKSHRNLLPRGE